MSGTKHDQDKVRVDLLDPLALEGLAQVLTFGAKKYAEHNWRGGLSYSRLLGAALRHTFAILRGEDVDQESGLPHIDHLGCCWMFLSNMMKTRPDLDDRWKPPLLDKVKTNVNSTHTDSYQLSSGDYDRFAGIVRGLQNAGYLQTKQTSSAGFQHNTRSPTGNVDLECCASGSVCGGSPKSMENELHDANANVITLNLNYLDKDVSRYLTNLQHSDEDVK